MAKRTCPFCGTELRAEVMHGLCPKCVLKGATAEADDPEATEAAEKVAAGPQADQPTVGQGGEEPPPGLEPDSVPSGQPALVGGPGTVSPTQPVGADPTVFETVLEKPGDRIGRYKLLQQLGRGGMGSVWMAEQTEPVRRMVALKVIKPGMDSAEVLARFEAERQALALMDHPNIAKVLDAGATPQGRPYFVMDLVKGIPLTRFCDEQRLSVRERLELFLPVCQAVQHAHQKGVIHRDLKPSNVLVALYDGKPVPKVIDFGLAKAAGQQLTERTLYTQLGAVVGTLEYMSPEQAELNQLDIDTRSDIYSLGVLLYELLTGTTPLTRDTLCQGAFEDVLRRIREEEPPKPSLRLSTTREQLPAISSQRKLEPEKLTKAMRGDLDWIVMKALEKERSRRYETASGFASDLQRYLNDEPVMAGPPTARYRVKKFVRKHRRAVAVAAGFVVLMTVAAIVSMGLAVWANWERKRADKLAQEEEWQRRRAEGVLGRMQIQWAEERLSADQAAPALAYLARVLRQEPSHGVAALRLVSALTQRDFSLPVCPPLRHAGGVNSAQFSPDGRWVVTASEDQTARLWDANSGQPLTAALRHEGPVRCVQFSPDGQKVVTASEDKTARLWDARTGQALTEPLKHDGSVRAAQFSPDGRKVASASDDRTARVWDAQSGQPLTPALQHSNIVLTVQFSPDGQSVLTACWDSTARLWDARTGQPLLPPLEHGNVVLSARFSPDGRQVVTVSWDNTARVWDARTGQALTPPLEHRSFVNFAQFSPDGQRIVTAADDETARIWDSHQGSPLTGPMPLNGRVTHAAFSPDGQRVVTTGSFGAARVWDVHTGQPLAELLRHEGRVHLAQFSPDGQRVVTASGDGTARIWDVRPGRALAAVCRHDECVTYAQFSPDGRHLQTLASRIVGRVGGWVWDARTGQCLQPRQDYGSYIANWFNPYVVHARLSPDGQWLATVSGDTEARVWDARTGQPVSAPLQHNGKVDSVQFSPDGQRIVTASSDKTARIWDARTGRPLTDPLRHESFLVTARFGPDGRQVITASRDKTARVWDAQTGQPLTEPLWHGEPVVAAQLSPREKLAVTVTEGGSAWLWDWSAGRRLAGPLKHDHIVVAVEFSPDGQRVLTASYDKTARIWDTHTGRLLTEPLRHGHYVLSARFDRAGQKVVTASWDRTARLWDVATGLPLAEPFRHGGRVDFAEFSSDGRRIVTASGDSTARIWETPEVLVPVPPWLLDLAEALAGQKLDEQGVVQSVSLDELVDLLRRLTNSPASDPYTRWAHWFLADRAARAISPASDITIPAYLQSRLGEDTLESLQEAVRLSPTNGLALAKLAKQTLVQDANANPRQLGEADFLSRRAVELSPNDPEPRRIRADILEQIKNTPKP